jgi:secondary thiamine-phosphate synthase enzyme
MLQRISIRTASAVELIDITNRVQHIIDKTKLINGLCIVFVPHTTAGITINENADPSVQEDILKELNKVIPFDDNYSHSEGNAAAHIKASILGSSVTVFIENSRLALGRWQGIYFAEFDGPRSREVWVKIIENQK